MMKGHLHRNVIGLLTMGLPAAAMVMMTAVPAAVWRGKGRKHPAQAERTSRPFIVDRLGTMPPMMRHGYPEFEARPA